jgi:hypothetical protein
MHIHVNHSVFIQNIAIMRQKKYLYSLLFTLVQLRDPGHTKCKIPINNICSYILDFQERTSTGHPKPSVFSES